MNGGIAIAPKQFCFQTVLPSVDATAMYATY